MNQEGPLHTYVAGDEVQLAIEIVHAMNLSRVYAVYRHETNDTKELILGDEEVSPPEFLSQGEKRSRWLPNGVIGSELTPGIYNLHRLELVTAGERVISFRDEELSSQIPETVLSIRIVEEPDTMPYFGTVQLES